VNTVWPSADASDYSFFRHVMTQSTYFIRGFSISIKSVMKDDREDLVMSFRRQNLVREQGSLQKVLLMVDRLTDISVWNDITGKLLLIYIFNFHVLSHFLLIYICKLHWNDITVKGQPKIVKTDEIEALLKMGEDVLSLCFEFLYYAIRGNAESQL
jgi:RIH domain